MRRPKNETILTWIAVVVSCIVLLLIALYNKAPKTTPEGVPWENDSDILYYPSHNSGDDNTESSAPDSPAPISDPVNINDASKEELMTLPGIGATLADRIIAYRDQNGKFEVIEDLMNVSGIGEGKFSAIKDLICV